MGDLFFNKVAGAILGVGLLIMGLLELSHIVMHAETPDEPAYPIDLAALEGASAAEEEEPAAVDFGLLLASADLSAGERVTRRCASCHSFDQGGANGTGPALWDVMGRNVAAVDGFGYSGAMTDYAEGGQVWGYQNMYDYLANPRRYLPGTAMSFAGLRDQAERINIIAYMRSQSDDPIALPAPLESAAAEIAAETDAG